MADFLKLTKHYFFPKQNLKVCNSLETNVLTNGTAADAMLRLCLSELGSRVTVQIHFCSTISNILYNESLAFFDRLSLL